jgi:hypothetical protein
MRNRIKLKGGDEHDVLTRWRKFISLKSHEAKKIKRGYNKRFRKEGNQHLKSEVQEDDR